MDEGYLGDNPYVVRVDNIKGVIMRIQLLTPPTIEIVGFLGGAARFIAKPCLKQRVMRFPIIHYGCSA